MRCNMRMLGIGKSSGRIIHRTDHISRKRQCGIMSRRQRGQSRSIIVPLRPIHCFHRHQMRIRPLPSTGNGGSMEIHHQFIFSRIFQQIQIIIHCFHLVTGKEIDLNTGYPLLRKPLIFFFPIFFLIQPVHRPRSSVSNPRSTRIIP